MNLVLDHHLHFDAVDLGDSIVLAWESLPNRFVLELELSLLPTHPNYEPPPPEHRSCFRKGSISFESVTAQRGLYDPGDVEPTTDVDGSYCYDTLHCIQSDGEREYYVEGEFGEVYLTSDKPTLRIGNQVFQVLANSGGG